VHSFGDWAGTLNTFRGGEHNLNALERMAAPRTFRNLVAHFGMLRFPDDDAFHFITKSEADYRRQASEEIVDDAMLIAVLDGPILPGSSYEIGGFAGWLAIVTAQILKGRREG
jgi:hypothetical protein